MDTATTPTPAQQQRFHFYNAQEIRLTETVLQTVGNAEEEEAEPQQHKMDSTEILKSLQEHEQQRLSILSDAAATSSGEVEDAQRRPVVDPTATLDDDTPPLPPPQNTTHDDDDDNDTLNPYQEAIHEALELLRHNKRTTTTSYGQADERQERAERYQKYTARLQELKQQEDDALLLPATSSLSEDEAPAVERVLMAILQTGDEALRSNQEEELQSQDEERDLQPSCVIAAHPSDEMMIGRDVVETTDAPALGPYSEGEDDADDELDAPMAGDRRRTSGSNHTASNPSVLGPLGQQDTGVVLDHSQDDDDDLPTDGIAIQPTTTTSSSRSGVETSDQSYSSSGCSSTSASTNNSAPTHILESLSAAVSYMTGGARSETEKEALPDPMAEEEDDDDDDEDTETAILRSLCSHLIPRSTIPRPQWDEANGGELGYRIVRISNEQLERMEDELSELLAEFALDDNARDEHAVPIATSVPASPRRHVGATPLQQFPGIKAAGGGEMGDLEYFVLPVIYKSHVTGFEPVKDMVLEPGNVLAGQYLVEGVLGSAAFSTAYKCVDLSTNTDVCLKVIKNTKDFFDQSLDEIKILELLRQTGQCQENYIVEMKTFFYHREHLIIVTELLRQNLFEFGKFIMDSGEEPYFTIPRLAYVTRQCLISLRFVHSLGLVHSDVKPENILLSSYSRASVKLIDFGSSCYLTDRQSSYIQSRSYRAPEVCLGLPYDGRIDIWSLGCVVAEMYTGEVTFQNDSVVSMLSRIEAICGAFPRHMIANGRQSSHFFTKTGLIYEREEEEDGAIDIFQPKETTLQRRLGNPHDDIFLDFIRQLLTIDPELRPTAEQALEHPWMKYAETLDENDILYPRP